MKNFIFDEYRSCINPNRIELGDSKFYVEIRTAFNNGKWYAAYWYWTNGRGVGDEPHLDTCDFNEEYQAICFISIIALKHLESEKQSVRSLDVPDNIFKELKELRDKNKTPQLTLNF